ncbi:hypothetical protein EJB05_25768, partial [Eragrostis curvula]
MPLPAFVVAAAKLAVLVAAAATAANAASFARYRRRQLRRIPNPIDESADPVADFRALPHSAAAGSTSEDDSFFFGLATAPAHVEDRLEDAWLQFAIEHSCDEKEAVRDQKPANALLASAAGDGGSQVASRSRGDEQAEDREKRKPLKVAMEAMLRGFETFVEGGESGGSDNCSHNVAAWHNVPCPHERLKFWSDPDTELKLAKETGISVFRMGIDWTRVMPKEPTEDSKSSEVISGPGLKLVDNDEYSESGRGVYPDGLFRVLIQFNERYKSLNIPFIITENGVSDETDLIRKPYIIEHLLAIYAAIIMGVRVLGYLFWTTSDNWEWADGYGPKFGLVAVDRANNLARKPRPSYYLFSKVVTTGKITRQDRAWAWRELQKAAFEKKTRPFFRAADKHGRIWTTLKTMVKTKLVEPPVDCLWRYGVFR